MKMMAEEYLFTLNDRGMRCAKLIWIDMVTRLVCNGTLEA